MSESLKGLQVLLIEDEPDIAELLHFILFQNGAAVTVATTALEGLLVLNEQQPQVLVCNLRLPDMDGRQLIQRVRSLPDATVSQVPAIAVTSYDRECHAESALLAGFNDFLAKPLEPASLVAAILALTVRKRTTHIPLKT